MPGAVWNTADPEDDVRYRNGVIRFPTEEDVAEMKARGYDSTTLAEARRRLPFRARASALCEEIRAAFAGVKLGNGVGLNQAAAQDSWADATDEAIARRSDEKENWERLVSFGYRFSYALYASPEGARFHLPAYLIEDLQADAGWQELYCLTESPGPHFSLLSPAQRRVVRKYLLLHQDECGPNDFYEGDVERSLQEYWTEPKGESVPGATGSQRGEDRVAPLSCD